MSLPKLVPQTLRIGGRFSIKNQVFEITHVNAHMVRYASCQGGRPLVMPTDKFWELVDQDVIGFLSQADQGTSINSGAMRLSTLSDADRNELMRRIDYIKEAMRTTRKYCSKKNLIRAILFVQKKISDISPPGKSTLARWISQYIASNLDVMSIAPRHQFKGRHEKRFSIEIEMVIDHALNIDYLTENRCSAVQLYTNIIGRLSEAFPPIHIEDFPSLRTIHRRVNELDPYLVARQRLGKKYADSQFRAAGASIKSDRLMEIVMMDGHKMDVLVVDGDTGEVLGRPFLVCLFDICTRTVVGWHISLLPFCSTTALAAIKDMCSRNPLSGPGGVPESITPDNGPDLASQALRNLCMKLGIHITPAKTYTPDDKANLERFFRTLNTCLIHMLDGTTFSSLSDRGDYDSVAKATITLEKLHKWVEKWLTTVYHVKKHSTTRRVPALHWRDQQNDMPIMHFPSEEIDVIARVACRRKISNGRVIHDNLIYKSDALRTLESRKQSDVVVLTNELDLSYVYVYSESDPRALVRADGVDMAYMAGLTKYEHEECKKTVKAMEEKDRLELGIHLYEIARWQLWKEIHSEPNTLSAKKLALLTQGAGKQTTATSKLSQLDNHVVSTVFNEIILLNPSAGSIAGFDGETIDEVDVEMIEL
jgi:putative transposase